MATFVRVAPDSTGTKIQTTEVVDGADTVARQHTRIDGAALAEVADVRNAAPTDTDYGVVVRPIVSGILYSGTLGAMNAAVTTDDRAIGCSLFHIESDTAITGGFATEATIDGTTWFGLYGMNETGGQLAGWGGGPHRHFITGSGWRAVRFRVSSYTSGSTAARILATFSQHEVRVGILFPGYSQFALGKQEDGTHVSGDVGVGVWGVRNDARTSMAGSTGKYIPFSMGPLNELHVGANDPTTAGTPAAVTVSTSAVLLKASNAARKSILITNNGTTPVYLGHTSGVTASGAAMGLLLAPAGSYSDSGFGLYTGDLYAIGAAAVAAENVSISERT